MSSNIKPIEIVSMSLAGALLVALGVGAFNYTRNHGNAVNRPPFVGELPATGVYVGIDEVETYWKENTRGQLVPVATITLGSLDSDGTLRVLFKSNVGNNFEPSNYIGDSNTLKITGGSFSNGTKSVTIQCTKGFGDLASFLGYKAMEDTRWVVELREAAPETRKASEFQALTHRAIEPILLETAE